MSPSADDLRALLAERADGAPAGAPFDASTGARLAGVRARIRQRRRARGAAAALAVALVAGSATVVTANLQRHPPAPAAPPGFPARDLGGRPLSTVLTLASPAAEATAPQTATTTLQKGTALHLAARCDGSSQVTVVVLVNGAGVGRLGCGAAPGDVYLEPGAAKDRTGLDTELPVTVGMYLTVTPRAGALPVPDGIEPLAPATAELAVYSAAPALPVPVPPDESPAASGYVLLNAAAWPVTEDFGRRTFPVVHGGAVAVTEGCSAGPGGPRFAIIVGAGDHDLYPAECAASGRVSGGALWDTGKARAFLGVDAGRPSSVSLTLRVLPPSGDWSSGAPLLARTLPGGTAAVAAYGVPYLPDALRSPTLLAPPEVDARGRPLVLSLFARPEVISKAIVRVTGPDVVIEVTCGASAGAGTKAHVEIGQRTDVSDCAERGAAHRVPAPDDPALGETGISLVLDGDALRPGDGDTGAVLAVYGPVVALQTLQGVGNDDDVLDVAGALPRAAGGKGATEPLTTTLTARGGQRTGVPFEVRRAVHFTVTCTGTSENVRIVLLVDGKARVGDLRGPPEACRPRTGFVYTPSDVGPGRHDVELRVTGPEAAAVTLGIYGAVV